MATAYKRPPFATNNMTDGIFCAVGLFFLQ